MLYEVPGDVYALFEITAVYEMNNKTFKNLCQYRAEQFDENKSMVFLLLLFFLYFKLILLL